MCLEEEHYYHHYAGVEGGGDAVSFTASDRLKLHRTLLRIFGGTSVDYLHRGRLNRMNRTIIFTVKHFSIANPFRSFS